MILAIIQVLALIGLGVCLYVMGYARGRIDEIRKEGGWWNV